MALSGRGFTTAVTSNSCTHHAMEIGTVSSRIRKRPLWQTRSSMRDLIDSDGFRANVGIVLMRSTRESFLGRQVGGRGWQFPQGGVRPGESLEAAAYRELDEEVGLSRSDVILIGRTRKWLRYRLPPKYVRRNQQPLCIGQKQRWFLLRLRRDDIRFDFARTAEPEFEDYRWVGWWEPVREVIFFKRGVYVRALTELAPLAFPEGIPPLPQWWRETVRSEAGTAPTAPASIE
jgi:putative (di)nucleoside polyphosphate hydrolase